MVLTLKSHWTMLVIASASVTFALSTLLTPVQAAVGITINPPVFPLNRTAVPDINEIGLLDKTGVNSEAWPKITNNGQKTTLRQLGKALFWDMQVGGDGIQSCATCHYHAGADHRKKGQMSPGLKADDTVHDLINAGTNGTLSRAHYSIAGNPNRGLPVSEAALIASGSIADAQDGSTGIRGVKPDVSRDVNDVVSSQGVRAGVHAGVNTSRIDNATLSTTDAGFNYNFSNNAASIPNTVRRVEPRNAPTVLNSIYNFRNFWDGRADAFFNGVNPLGFRDPGAVVKTYSGGVLRQERLNIPFSSLASQAVGPIGSDFEMAFSNRSHSQLGKKLLTSQPLNGQLISCGDSLLGAQTNCTTPGVSNRGLSGDYASRIRASFDQRFWGNGSGGDVCLNGSGSQVACGDPTQEYTLMEWNFALFFGLAIQAYEATLTTEDTIVDLLVGGKAIGTLTNGTGNNAKVVNVTSLPLEACIANLALNNSAAQQAVATNLCTAHYAKFIHPLAVTGTESATAPRPVPARAAIGGCSNPLTCNSSPNQANAQATLLNVDRGLGRFFAGATGCSVCHFNPEFTGATVQAATGFGAGPVAVLPPGQAARAIEAPAVMERMIAFNGARTVYDTGFYNIGVRPTPDDISLGDQIDGVPLAFTKLAEVIAGGSSAGLDMGKINTIARWFATGNILMLPTSPTNLTPVPFQLNLVCGPGLNAPNANNNPSANCAPNVIPGERLLRNGAFKAQGLRNVQFTGPYMHNGSKMNLRQVMEFYKTAGHFTTLNLNNLDAGLRNFNLATADESAVVELMETGLTDWRLAHEQGKFDHPEICIPNGHDPVSGKTKLVGIPAVGSTGNTLRLQTFEEQLAGTAHTHNLNDACTVPGVSLNGNSTIDVPPSPL